MVRVNDNSGRQPGEQLISDMSELMGEMTRAGAQLDTTGLRPMSEGMRVKLSPGKISGVDSPFIAAQGSDRWLRDEPGEVDG